MMRRQPDHSGFQLPSVTLSPNSRSRSHKTCSGSIACELPVGEKRREVLYERPELHQATARKRAGKKKLLQVIKLRLLLKRLALMWR